MPERIVSHWNAQGVANGTMSKFIGTFFTPIMMIILLAVLIFLPKLDKMNVTEFRSHYDLFIIVMMVFFFYLQILIIAWNRNIVFNMVQFLSPGFALLFFFCGILISHTKKNWLVGIRTPWTLTSDKSWDLTHKLGGKLFKVCGIISLGGLIFPNIGIFFVMIPVILSAVFLIVYSYVKR